MQEQPLGKFLFLPGAKCALVFIKRLDAVSGALSHPLGLHRSEDFCLCQQPCPFGMFYRDRCRVLFFEQKNPCVIERHHAHADRPCGVVPAF